MEQPRIKSALEIILDQYMLNKVATRLEQRLVELEDERNADIVIMDLRGKGYVNDTGTGKLDNAKRYAYMYQAESVAMALTDKYRRKFEPVSAEMAAGHMRRKRITNVLFTDLRDYSIL